MGQQTSYTINTPMAAYPGQLADGGFRDVVSALAVAAAVPYGLLVVTDTSNTADVQHRAAKVPALATDITAAGSALGVVLAQQAIAQNPAVTGPQYPQYFALPILRQGRVWVYAEEAVTDGAGCYVRFASGAGGTQAGSFRADADSTTAALLPNAKFVSTTTAAGYAQVELNLV